MKYESPNNAINIELNHVPIQWNLDKGNLTFFGLDSALFWTVPSLSNMLAPIAEEIGVDLFRLLIAHSSSLGTEEDYHAMVSTLGSNFKDGFIAWGKAVSVAGWGCFEITEYNPLERQSVVIVKNPWELSAQKDLSPENRWGAPFLQGKLIGIFSHAFQVPCWAVDTCHFDAETPYVEIRIFQSNMTIADELSQLRHKRVQDKERNLIALIDRKTIELQETRKKIQEYAEGLERKIEERTANLVHLNLQLEAEINIRKEAEEKLARLNQELLALSMTDTLTGIANRRCFDKVLRDEWNRAIRAQNALCLIIADVDYFKKYNDMHGHQAGDYCLQLIAKLLSKHATRATDLVARYGGEEFALVLPMTRLEEASVMVEKIMMGLSELNVRHSASDVDHVTMSFGIVQTIPQESHSIELLFKAADDALYSAKEAGRNRYVALTL